MSVKFFSFKSFTAIRIVSLERRLDQPFRPLAPLDRSASCPGPAEGREDPVTVVEPAHDHRGACRGEHRLRGRDEGAGERR